MNAISLGDATPQAERQKHNEAMKRLAEENKEALAAEMKALKEEITGALRAAAQAAGAGERAEAEKGQAEKMATMQAALDEIARAGV